MRGGFVRPPDLALEGKAVEFFARGTTEPFLERVCIRDLSGNRGGEMREELELVEDLGLARLFGAVAQGAEKIERLAKDRRRVGDFAGEESVAEEDLAGPLGVESGIVAAAGLDDDKSVEGNLLGRTDKPGLSVPGRGVDMALDDVLRNRLKPRGINDRRFSGKEPRRVDKLAGDDPGRLRR